MHNWLCPCRFNKRISDFADAKFSDGIVPSWHAFAYAFCWLHMWHDLTWACRKMPKWPCPCRFDKRISDFAEAKFSRDGIRVLTEKRVVEVKKHEVVMVDMKTKEKESLPHGGLVVWSTGIGTRPLARRLMDKVGQVRISPCPGLMCASPHSSNSRLAARVPPSGQVRRDSNSAPASGHSWPAHRPRG
jgi:hypothetical protein